MKTSDITAVMELEKQITAVNQCLKEAKDIGSIQVTSPVGQIRMTFAAAQKDVFHATCDALRRALTERKVGLIDQLTSYGVDYDGE